MDIRDKTEEMYSKMHVVHLKAELKKRKASLRGKKKDLLERLIYYHRNDNFVNKAPNALQDLLNSVVDDPYWTPDDKYYKDINANSPIPPVTDAHIKSWCARFFVNSNTGESLYKSKYLLTSRFAPHMTFTFVRSDCKPEMTKSGHYTADVQLSSRGEILSAHCECSVGSGDKAHCKHVVACLYGAENIVREGKIILRTVCTQELQTFHHPAQPYFGTPIKCATLPSKNEERVKSLNFLPLEPSSLCQSSYQDKVRNLVINYSAANKDLNKLPLKQTYKPANTYGVDWDHKYSSVNPAEQILNDFKLLSITTDEAVEIERETRGQADSDLWRQTRSVRITSSLFGDICKTKSVDAKKSMAFRLLNSTTFTSQEVEHGKINEPKAIKQYEETENVKVQSSGLVISTKYPYLAGSPDGLQGDDVTLEVKCPFSAKEQLINHITVPYLIESCDGKLLLDSNSNYYYQVQGQMFVTGRNHAKFIVFTFKDFKVLDICRDEEFIRKMVGELKTFFQDYFKPALLEKYLFKYYSAAFFS